MAQLTNIPENSRLAINRIAMFSEKEKRLLQVAIDAAKSATETSIVTDIEAVLAEYEEQTVKWYLMAGTTNQSSVNPARRFMAIGTSAVTLNLDAAASVKAYSYTSPEGVDITWEGNITIANASTQTLTVNPGSGEYFVVNGSSLAPDTAVTLAPGDLIHIIPDTDGDPFWYVHKNESGSGGGGSGDVTKVGTPVNDQIGVWTGDGTIEGTSGLTYTGTALTAGNYVFNTDQSLAGKTYYSLYLGLGGEIELGIPPVEISLDTSPLLGGNLDVGTYEIVSTSNNDIGITSNGSGNITLSAGTTGDINLTPGSTSGNVVVDYSTWPSADGTNGYVLTTNGAGALSWTLNGTGSGLGDIVDDLTPQLGGTLDSNNFDIEIKNTGTVKGINFYEPSGGGTSYARIVAPALSANYTLTLPTTDGNANEVLKTDGSGNLSWVTNGGGVTTFTGLSDTPASYATYAGDWLKVNAGATALEFVDPPIQDVTADPASPVTTFGTTSIVVGMPAAAAPSTDGYMSGADKAKLNAIEALADVTDAANVAAAGAIMDTDFFGTGIMVKKSGSYVPRVIAAGNGISVSNGDGDAANPTISTDYTISTSAPSGTPSAGHVWYRY